MAEEMPDLSSFWSALEKPIPPPAPIQGVESKDFMASVFLLYSGLQVAIRVGEGGKEYTLPKALLCKQSPYFAAMFDGKFQEGEQKSSTLGEIEGVLSVRSFESLIQWLFVGRIVIQEDTPEDVISRCVELMRLAVFLGITEYGLDVVLADRIKQVIKDNPVFHTIVHHNDTDNDGWGTQGIWHGSSRSGGGKKEDSNTTLLSIALIGSASVLPQTNPVRRAMAEAVVRGYFLDSHFFGEVAEEVPSFEIDLLLAVQAATKTLHKKWPTDEIVYQDPTSGEEEIVPTVPWERNGARRGGW